MTLSLPFEALFILYKLQQAGFQAFIVGGAVRDIIIHSLINLDDKNNKNPPLVTDYDFTTDATPEEIQKIFSESFYENEFGMVGVTHENLIEQIKQEIKTTPQENLQTIVQAKKETKKEKIIDIKNASKIHEALVQDDQLKEVGQVENQGESPLGERGYPGVKNTQTTTQVVHPFEITTFRSDGIYKDFRRPTSVTWGKTIEEDLERRDFTINSMALAIKEDKLKKLFAQQKIDKATFQIQKNDYQLIDLHDGMKDLTANLVKTVGNPNKRFQEDALRMLRAIRFAVQLNMEIDPAILESTKANAGLISHISWERIRDEFLKMLVSDQAKKAIELLDETTLLRYVLPEILEMKGVDQGGHHTTDVWVHSLDAADNCPSKDPIVRLATLLHDLGKPATYKIINGQVTAYNHEILGSRIASKIGKRFRLSKKELQRLFILVRYHMFYYQPHHTDAAIRRIMKNVGLENIDDILDLREGDRLGSGARKTSWRLEELKQRMIEQLHQPMDTRDLAINGHDLIKNLGLKPGPKLGEILNKLLEIVLDEPELNEKAKLLKKAKKML